MYTAHAAASGLAPTESTKKADPAATNGMSSAPAPPAESTKTTTSGGRPKRVAATNARELLSGKREREGFFDAEDDARARNAAKRAAAVLEKQRAEETLIEGWREEDRLKQVAKRAEKAKTMVADGGDEKRTQNVDDTGNGGPAHVDTQTDTTNETSETELRPREQYDANGDLIVGTTGRSKKNPPPQCEKEKKLVPPSAPPPPTQPWHQPLSTANGVPVFGCTACGYSRHGCDVCLKGPKVRSSYQPKNAVHMDVPPVPTYYPTELEWAGDPLAYINSIRPEAEQYGVCNIVAPESFKPEFRLPNAKELRFRTRVQAVTELQNRPAGPSKRSRENEHKARAALVAAGLEVPEGFTLAGGNLGGGRMGGGRIGGATTAPAPRTPPEDTKEEGGLPEDEPQALEDKPPATEAKKNTPSDDTKATAILAQYGFIPGERHTVASLEAYSNYFKKKYFSERGVPTDVSVRDLEGEFWRLIESSADTKQEVEVIYGADIATLEVGSGFTSPGDDCLDAPDQKKYADSPWNVCNMPYNPSSCLKHVEATTGITVPWLYFGMTLSTFCWHVEDHHFYSVNYHHFGDPKVWYSIPASHSEKFERVMRERLPHLFDAQPDLLHSLVTILSPAVLREEGIPVFRAEQHPRSYVITFPNAYHAGFNTGFNCAEAVNFAPVDWLPFGAAATEQYVLAKRYQSVAHDQLLGTLCVASETQLNFTPTVALVMRHRVDLERTRRATLTDAGRVGEGKIVKMAGTELAPDLFEKDCSVCQADLNWAGVRCECKGRKLFCLRCFDKKECKHGNEKNTMLIRSTIDELEAMCVRLERLATEFEANKDKAPVETVSEEWIACDSCGKWRRVPGAMANALGDDDKWTCAENSRPNFNTCDAPEEKMGAGTTWVGKE